jgi:hypothetical protein
MAKTDLPALASPGSRALKNAKYERYCRLRASAQSRISAYRQAGWETRDGGAAYSNACRVERAAGVRDRIAYLTRQAEELIAEKRQRIEEQLWAICGDFFEPYDTVKRNHTGQPEHTDEGGLSTETRMRPKLLTDLPPKLAALIEDITFDNKGRAIPKLFSKLQANAELRKMLNISAKEAPRDVTQLSDVELIETLARQAKELGVVDLSYSFAQPKKEPDK